MNDREKGVASTECSGCGAELQLVTALDGSVVPENCDTCFPAPDGSSRDADGEQELASLHVAPEEVVDVDGDNGDLVEMTRETGTYNEEDGDA